MPNPREQKVVAGLTQLEADERRHLEIAAEGYFLGGDQLLEPLRSLAVGLELAYQSTGRLRPDTYKIFRGDTAVFANR